MRAPPFIRFDFCCLAAVFLLLFAFVQGCGSTGVATGTWSAPSLSRPEVPIFVSLHPDGAATEKIGDFHGAGKWSHQGRAALIQWESGWSSLLRPAKTGAFELLTWKRGVPMQNAPSDVQPARYLGPGKLPPDP